MQATIDRKQLNDLIDNLKTIGDEVVDAVFSEIEATALEIETEAKLNCPVDTGNLRASIKAIMDRKAFAAGVFTPVEYAPYVEFGTSRQQAHPYLYPAYFAGIGRLMRNLENVMKNVKGDK